MSTIKKTIYLHWKSSENYSDFFAGETNFDVLDDYRLLTTVEVEFDIGDFDPYETELANLEAMVQKERADSQVRVNLLLDRIGKLKAIGHEVVE